MRLNSIKRDDLYFPNKAPNDVIQLIKDLLIFDKYRRPDIKFIYNSGYFKNRSNSSKKHMKKMMNNSITVAQFKVNKFDS